MGNYSAKSHLNCKQAATLTAAPKWETFRFVEASDAIEMVSGRFSVDENGWFNISLRLKYQKPETGRYMDEHGHDQSRFNIVGFQGGVSVYAINAIFGTWRSEDITRERWAFVCSSLTGMWNIDNGFYYQIFAQGPHQDGVNIDLDYLILDQTTPTPHMLPHIPITQGFILTPSEDLAVFVSNIPEGSEFVSLEGDGGTFPNPSEIVTNTPYLVTRELIDAGVTDITPEHLRKYDLAQQKWVPYL